jgi:hypothetical protein
MVYTCTLIYSMLLVRPPVKSSLCSAQATHLTLNMYHLSDSDSGHRQSLHEPANLTATITAFELADSNGLWCHTPTETSHSTFHRNELADI